MRNNMNTFNRDYKLRSDNKPLRINSKGKPHYLLAIAGLLIGLGATLSIIPNTKLINPSEANANNEIDVKQATNPTLALTLPNNESSPANAHAEPSQQAIGKWQTLTVKTGDNLSTLFDRIGLSPKQLYETLHLSKDTKVLTRLFPGDTLDVYINENRSQLLGLKYDISETRILEITQGPNGLSSNIIERQLDTRMAHATGVINNSLFLSAQRVGLSDNLTMELAGIFGWDIDFALDIRQGDQFSVIYEELYLHGEKLRNGKILAAEFVNRNKSYRAIRYTDNRNRTDYYSPDGKSMRKAFLRTPVDFSRISSRFNMRRKHPVLNKIRAHKGVDYAAPRGTPIKATGDGKVILRGRKGGYGKTVIIQHGSNYSTLYAHMKGYARGIRNGKRVRQGQTIGYIGSTGLATGPHLHYEFRVSGSHRNPLTVKLPDAAPLAKNYKKDFINSSRAYLAQLDTLKRTSLALNNL